MSGSHSSTTRRSIACGDWIGPTSNTAIALPDFTRKPRAALAVFASGDTDISPCLDSVPPAMIQAVHPAFCKLCDRMTRIVAGPQGREAVHDQTQQPGSRGLVPGVGPDPHGGSLG